MKQPLYDLFAHAINQLKSSGVIPHEHCVEIRFERTRQKQHGDFATNLAMTLAKVAQRKPRELADLIVAALPENSIITQIDIAGPGFINLFVAQDAQTAVLDSVFTQGDAYGLATPNSKQKIMVEFVSANPTGPLHVGHGRGAAYGDALASVLAAAGHKVEREYYVNDAGRQMDILAVSVWIRYLQASGVDVALPDNGYQGAYVNDIAQTLFQQYAKEYLITAVEFSQARAGLEDEAALDATIALAKTKLGEDGFAVFFKHAINLTLADIKEDLGEFGIHFDTWFSERCLFDDGKISRAIEQLKASGDVYEKGGAWWFRGTDYGDEKDRVVIRENGQPTYFASDIAYHKDKFDRGFDLVLNIWGADHHGYIPRVKASMQALGLDPEKLQVLLVQFAVLYRDGQKLSMSTRSGEFITLRQLREDVGADAARFFYTQRKVEQHMDFDLDLAKSRNHENPLYYVQYAHARICRMFETAAERGIDTHQLTQADFSHLHNEHEIALLGLLQRFPEVVVNAARSYEPHLIIYYCRDLATAFHSYYNTSKFLEADAEPRNAMLALSAATRQVLRNALTIIGVSAPEKM